MQLELLRLFIFFETVKKYKIIIYIQKWLRRVGHAPASGHRPRHLGGVCGPRTEQRAALHGAFRCTLPPQA
jgi:hypothetical protein